MATTEFIWDMLNDNYLMEQDGVGATTAVYTNEPATFGELASQKRSGSSSYYHFDGQGSTRTLTDGSENVTDTETYTAFGEAVASSGTTTNPFGYAGTLGYYSNGEMGDLYVRARTYEPKVARWLSFDPLGLFDGVTRYEYSNNSPATFVDANGLLALTMQPGPIARLKCDALAAIIASFLDTPEEKGFFEWYTNPLLTGRDRNLSCGEVIRIVNGSTVGGQPINIHQGLEDALSACRKLGGGPHAVSGGAASGDPYKAALGSYTLKATITCVGCCAEVLIEVGDTYDFNVFGAKRALSAQLKTMGVALGQIVAKCNWVPYKISGRCAFIHCPAFLDPTEPIA